MDGQCVPLPPSFLCPSCVANGLAHERWYHLSRDIDWVKLGLKKLTPPIVPTVTADNDISNFDVSVVSTDNGSSPSASYYELFKDW